MKRSHQFSFPHVHLISEMQHQLQNKTEHCAQKLNSTHLSFTSFADKVQLEMIIQFFLINLFFFCPARKLLELFAKKDFSLPYPEQLLKYFNTFSQHCNIQLFQIQKYLQCYILLQKFLDPQYTSLSLLVFLVCHPPAFLPV